MAWPSHWSMQKAYNVIVLGIDPDDAEPPALNPMVNQATLAASDSAATAKAKKGKKVSKSASSCSKLGSTSSECSTSALTNSCNSSSTKVTKSSSKQGSKQGSSSSGCSTSGTTSIATTRTSLRLRLKLEKKKCLESNSMNQDNSYGEKSKVVDDQEDTDPMQKMEDDTSKDRCLTDVEDNNGDVTTTKDDDNGLASFIGEDNDSFERGHPELFPVSSSQASQTEATVNPNVICPFV